MDMKEVRGVISGALVEWGGQIDYNMLVHFNVMC
jgi:hypothetical protein